MGVWDRHIYTIELRIKEITNENLLHSSGNATEYSVVTQWKGNPRKRGVCRADSLCCTGETNAALQSNCTPITTNLKNSHCDSLLVISNDLDLMKNKSGQ